jgi:hypothetical protein
LLIGILIGATVGFAAPDGAPLLAPVGTAFIYQGYITDTGNPANGSYNLAFKLFNDASAGTQVGSTVTKSAVTVSDGYFTVELDFGDWFDGTALWLEIEVEGPGDSVFTVLGPRQPLSPTPYAINADKLDGFDASELGVDYQNVIIVAKSGGDYTSVQAAIDSIADASASNRYLVWVAPGEYSETVTMEPYVHLQGAGQEATIITSTTSNGSLPPSQATLVMASDVSLRDLTVGNSGAGINNVALLASAGVTRMQLADVTVRAQGGGENNYAIFLIDSGTDVRLQHVIALSENGSSINSGLQNCIGAAATLHGGSFTGRGGSAGLGIYNWASGTTLETESVTVLGENGSNYNYGLYNNNGAAATLRGGSFTGSGGINANGIYNTGSSTTLEVKSVTALGENGSSMNSGLHNNDGAMATMHGGSFTGSGGNFASGLRIYGSGTTLETESVTALGYNGSDSNYGLNLGGAVATLHGGSFTGRGGIDAYGIYSTGLSLEAENITALGKYGSSNDYGLYSDGTTSTANLTQSVLEGSDNSVYRNTGIVTVSNSRLTGIVGGAVTCVLVSRGTIASTDGSTTCP